MNASIKGYLLLVGAAALFGTTGTAQMLGAGGLDPWIVGAFRLIIGGPVLLAVCLGTGAWQRGSGASPGLVTAASLGTVLFQFTFFEAVARTGVATGTLVSIGSGPIIAGILGAVFFGERLDRTWALATGLSVTGCALLVMPGKEMQADPGGMALALAAGCGYAVYVVVGRELARTMAPSKAVGTILTCGALIMLPFLGFADLGPLAAPKVVLTLIYMGVFATALSYFMMTRGLVAVPVANAAVVLLVEPLVGAVLGICLLGEILTLWSGTGMVLIFSGMALIALRHLRCTGPPATVPADESQS